MKALSKFVTGAATAAVLSVSLAAPAEARDRYDRRDRGIDVEDIITGAVVIGGVVAAADAVGNIGRYGYNYGRYGGGERMAVNACAYQAERYGRGRVQITDVERRNRDSYRVRGIVTGGYDAYDRGYDRRRDRDYGRYDYDRRDRDYGRYDYDRRDRDAFTCTVRGNGRVTGFRLRDNHARGYRRY